MTQEKKAKAYDEALERARKMLNMILDNELLGFPDQIREIFPQLKESKDEKIREEMIQYFTEMKKGGSAALPYDDCIAYLERQKEQKPADEAEKFFDSVESYNQGFVAGQKKMKEDIEKGFGISEHSLDYLAGRYAGYAAARQEQKPAVRSEEDEEMRNALWSLLKIQYAQDYSMTGVGIEAGKFRNWLNSLPKDSILKPKQEWSEDDDATLSWCISDIERAKYCKSQTKPELCDIEINWLKSLPERFSLQPKQEWSKGDEENFEWFDKFFRAESVVANGKDIPQDKYLWFKSLRPQSHWKPSTEQMKAIKHAYNSFQNDCSTKANLRLLYYDLEKLM